VCLACNSDQHLVPDCPHKKPGVYYPNPHKSPTAVQSNTGNNAGASTSSTANGRLEANTCSIVNCDSSVIACMSTDCVSAVKTPVLVKSPLKYIDVVINGTVHTALIDGGAEMPLIKSSLIGDISSVGSINIQPIVGKTVEAKLAVLDIAKFDETASSDCVVNECTTGPLHLVFAVTDLARQDVVLPDAVVQELQETSHKCVHDCNSSVLSLKCFSAVVNEMQLTDVDVSSVNINECINQVDDVVNVDSLNVDDDDCTSSRENLRSVQLCDESLRACRSLADQNKNSYFWDEGLLYHKDGVLNQLVYQLVMPKDRRIDIIKFAHDKCFHQGHKKTSERICYSFFLAYITSRCD
jgi:hypothetical protein